MTTLNRGRLSLESAVELDISHRQHIGDAA